LKDCIVSLNLEFPLLGSPFADPNDVLEALVTKEEGRIFALEAASSSELPPLYVGPSSSSSKSMRIGFAFGFAAGALTTPWGVRKDVPAGAIMEANLPGTGAVF